MPVISSLFLVLALAFAVLIGPQTRPWTWGPAMICLGLAVLPAIPAFWKRRKTEADFGTLALGALVIGWFAWRASISPVAELARADLLLAGGVLASFVAVRAVAGHALAERILHWGLALLLLASIAVIGMQLANRDFTPIFHSRATGRAITGFYAHYNEAANYLIASAALVGAAALFGNHRLPTRILWGLIAAAGLAGVWLTRSRGGILAAAVACGVFAALLLILGKKRNAKWFVPLLIALPVIGIVVAAYLVHGWKEAQNLRQAGSGIELLLDNNSRLYFLGIAMSCIGLHPMAGGGARSFSWECFRFVDAKDQGDIITHRPELVHNELVQAATDYGLIGAGLLVGLLGTLVIAALLRLIFESAGKDPDTGDCWRLAGIAALAGMMVQSSFSFVYHLMPGAMLLGISLGMLSRSQPQAPGAKTRGCTVILTLAASACAVLLLPAGWQGLRTTQALWATHYGKQTATSAESRIDALTAALRTWPHSSFLQERAAIYQELSSSSDAGLFPDAASRALDDYQNALVLHPFEPGLAVNRANLLSQLHRDDEAELWYGKAIQLQGGMEPGFRAHFSLASHYLRKGLRLFDPANPEAGQEALEQSASQIEKAVSKMHYPIKDMIEPRVSIHESVGTAREAAGEPEAALEAYNFAAKLQNGARAHYRAAVLIGKMAVEAWSKRRPAEAMAKFIEARKRIGQARGSLPAGVTPSRSAEYTAYLDRTIDFLKGAKVTPEP